MTLPKTLTTIIGSAAALAMLPAMAGSASDSNVKTMAISIAGYDLSKPADAQIIYYKIQQAAKRVCRHSLAKETLREKIDEKKCRADSVERAVTQLNAPQLTLVMTERNPTS